VQKILPITPIKYPDVFFRIGAGNKAKGITSGVHTPTFNIDENAIEIGIGMMALLGAEATVGS